MIQNLAPKQKDALKAVVILVVALIGVVGYFDYFMWRPKVKQLDGRIAEVQKTIDDMDARIKEINLALKDVAELQRKEALLAQIAKKLPDTPDAPGFYNALVKILQTTRIDYSELVPMPPAERPAYTEIPYRIVCRGRYHDFGQFLNLIEENPDRFMRVKTFKIQNDNERPSLHPVTVELGTFMFTRR